MRGKRLKASGPPKKKDDAIKLRRYKGRWLKKADGRTDGRIFEKKKDSRSHRWR